MDEAASSNDFVSILAGPHHPDLHKSRILAGDAQLPHHGVQRRAWHPETGGCGADHATGFPQNADDIFTLHFCERAAGSFHCISPQFPREPRGRMTDLSMKFACKPRLC